MLVGISGRKYSGKDTAYEIIRARILAKLPGKTVQKYAFAESVKLFASQYFDVDLSSPKESYRKILQGIGEMVREEIDTNFWVKRVLAQYLTQDFYSPEGEHVGIITDVRYPNEVEAVRQQHGVLLRISREGGADDQHHSEVALSDDDFQHVIYNNGTLEEFRMKVIEWTNKTFLLPNN